MSNENGEASPENGERKSFWKLWLFTGELGFDLLSSVLLLTPLLPIIQKAAGETNHFTLYSSLIDLGILAALRLLVSFAGLLIAYCRAKVSPEYPFDLYHANGERKSREELEQEALEEAFWPWFTRYIKRPSFLGEFLCVITQLVCVFKCLVRMNIELGILYDSQPFHPVFWLSILLTAILSFIEATYLDSMCNLAGEYGQKHLREPPGFLRNISSTLSLPLLATAENGNEEQEQDEEQGEEDLTNVRGESDIGPDANYKATWTDLLHTCYPDIHLICCAFVFLLLAAIAQVYIPRFLGNILDSLAEAFSDADDDASHKETITDVPGFMKNVKLLVVASIAAGVFAGLRGSIFTVVGGRVNVRLRVQLMDSLLSQDIGFFDVTKTGDITSRLSSDTTLVGDQVTLNVNVFLRSLVQALGVLLFMFMVSWQLSILAFISVPLITILSKVYGNFVRSLTKLMQKKLADGNSVCEAALSSMPTVRSFDAAEAELKDFEKYMQQYLDLNVRAAVAYCGYAAFTTAVPQLVFALVVFYGGYLVRNGNLTSGQLVSFLLYLQSLSDAFASIGYVFSSLTQAVGAADKVFELMHRRPKYTDPSVPPQSEIPAYTGVIGTEATKTRRQRLLGLRPENPVGEIELEDVELFYPARPNRRILNGLSLKIEAGSIVALVGKSGGGKSSIMSLIQHLYEQSRGKVLIDGHEVHQLSPEWLSRNVSIVSQEPTLFGRSIERNIMYGLEGTDMEPSHEEIVQAARLANADDFIQRMPQKYETEVGERGVQLSGGQKQRIAIARALVRAPKILLLDEATSALDAESEHLVQQAIDDMIARGKSEKGPGSMTVLIVAHRLSTVRNADTIFVVQDGQVVERGSHDELLKDPDGAYSALIRRQMQAQEKLESGKNTEGEDALKSLDISS